MAIYDRTLESEGRYVNNPNDPGKRTNRGITEKTYGAYLGRDPKTISDQEMQDISKEIAAEIYQSEYYIKPGIDKLPPAIQENVFDMGVNSGQKRAIRLLQKDLGIPEDGVIGQSTIDAAKKAIEEGTYDASKYSASRKNYYENLIAADSSLEEFRKGWLARADKFAIGPPVGPQIAAVDSEKSIDIAGMALNFILPEAQAAEIDTTQSRTQEPLSRDIDFASDVAAATRILNEPPPDPVALSETFRDLGVGYESPYPSIPMDRGELLSKSFESGKLGVEASFDRLGAIYNTIFGDEEAAAINLSRARIKDESQAKLLDGTATFDELLKEPDLDTFLDVSVKTIGIASAYGIESLAGWFAGATLFALSPAVIAAGGLATAVGKASLKKIFTDILTKKIIKKEAIDADSEGLLKSVHGHKKWGARAELGGRVGGFGASYAIGAPMALQEFEEAGKELNLDTAIKSAALGVPIALVDLLTEDYLRKTLFRVARTKASIAPGNSPLKNFAKAIGGTTIKGGISEGFAETSQESIVVAQRLLIDPAYSLQDTYLRLGESLFSGIMAGKAFGAAGGTLAATPKLAREMLNRVREKSVLGKIDTAETGVDNEAVISGRPTAEPLSDLDLQLELTGLGAKNVTWISNRKNVNDVARKYKIDLDTLGYDPVKVKGTNLSVAKVDKASSAQTDAQDGLVFSSDEKFIDEVLKGGATPEILKAALGYSAVTPANANSSVQVEIDTPDGPRVIFAQAVDSTDPEALAAARAAAERQQNRLPEKYKRNSRIRTIALAAAQAARMAGEEATTTKESGEPPSQTAAYEETGEGGVALPLDPLVQTINDLSKERDAILDQARIDDAGTYDVIKTIENQIKELVADKVQILNQIRAERDAAQPVGMEGVSPEIREFLDNVLRNNVAAGIRNEVDLYNKLFTGGLRREAQQDPLQLTNPEAVEQIQAINNKIQRLEKAIVEAQGNLSSESQTSLYNINAQIEGARGELQRQSLKTVREEMVGAEERRAPGLQPFTPTNRSKITDPGDIAKFETNWKKAESLIVAQSDPENYVTRGINIDALINFGITNVEATAFGDLVQETPSDISAVEQTANQKFAKVSQAYTNLLAYLRYKERNRSFAERNVVPIGPQLTSKQLKAVVSNTQKDYETYVAKNKNELAKTDHSDSVKMQRKITEVAEETAEQLDTTIHENIEEQVIKDIGIPLDVRQRISEDINNFRRFKQTVSDALVKNFISSLEANQRAGNPNFIYIKLEENQFRIVSQPKDVLVSESIADRVNTLNPDYKEDSYNTIEWTYKLVGELLSQSARDSIFVLKGPEKNHQSSSTKDKGKGATLKPEGSKITLGNVIKYGKAINIATDTALVGEGLNLKQSNQLALSRAITELKDLGYTIEVKGKDIFDFLNNTENQIIKNNVGRLRVNHEIKNGKKVTTYINVANNMPVVMPNEIVPGHVGTNGEIFLARLVSRNGVLQDFSRLSEANKELSDILETATTFETRDDKGQVTNNPFTLADYFFTQAPLPASSPRYTVLGETQYLQYNAFLKQLENLKSAEPEIATDMSEEGFAAAANLERDNIIRNLEFAAKQLLGKVHFIKYSPEFKEWYFESQNMNLYDSSVEQSIDYTTLNKAIMDYIGEEVENKHVRELDQAIIDPTRDKLYRKRAYNPDGSIQYFDTELSAPGDFADLTQVEIVNDLFTSRGYDPVSKLQYDAPSNKIIKQNNRSLYKAHNIKNNWSRGIRVFGKLETDKKYEAFKDFASRAFTLLKLNTPQHVVLLSDLMDNRDIYKGFFRDTYAHFNEIVNRYLDQTNEALKNPSNDNQRKILLIFKEILEEGEVTADITKKYIKTEDAKFYQKAVNRFEKVVDESLGQVQANADNKIDEVINEFVRNNGSWPLGKNIPLGDSNIIVMRDFAVKENSAGIFVRDKYKDVSLTAMLPIFGHELGHTFIREATDTLLKSSTKNDLIWRNLNNSFEAKKAELEELGITSTQYSTPQGLNEYIADQVGSWLMRETTKATNVAESWVKEIAGKLKKLFNNLANVLGKAFPVFALRFREDVKTQKFITEAIDKLKFNNGVERRIREGTGIPGIFEGTTAGISTSQAFELAGVGQSLRNTSPAAIAYAKNMGKKLLQSGPFRLAAKYLAASDNWFRTLGPSGVRLGQFFYAKSQSTEKPGFHQLAGNAERRFISRAENILDVKLRDGTEWQQPTIKKIFEIAENEAITTENIANLPFNDEIRNKAISIRKQLLEYIYDSYISKVSGLTIRKRTNFFPRQIDMILLLESIEAQNKLAQILSDPATNKNPISLEAAGEVVKSLIDNPLENGIEIANILDQKRSKALDGVETTTLRKAGLIQEAPQALLSYMHFITRKVELERKGGKKALDTITQNIINEQFGPESNSDGSERVPEEFIDSQTGEINENGLAGYKAAREKLRTSLKDAINKQFGRVEPLPSYMRQFNSVAAVTTATTTLLFTVFASLPDLGAVVLRQKSFGNFLSSLQEMQNRPYEERVDFARAAGAATFDGLEVAFTAVGEMDYANTWARSWMKTWFKYTGLSWWTRFTRVFAASMGRSYLINLSKTLGPDSTATQEQKTQAQRWLDEFPGLELNDILTWNSGDSSADNGFGFDSPEGEKVRDAIAKFVDESIIRPNPAQRPNWANNPWFSVLFQLKQFFYSYGKIVIGGAGREIKNRYSEDGHFGGGAMLMLMAAGTMLPLAALGIELKELARYLLQLGLGPIIPNEALGVREATGRTFRSDYTPTGKYTFELIEKAGWLGPLSMGVMAANSHRWGDNPVIGSVPMADALWDSFGKGEVVRLIPILNNIR